MPPISTLKKVLHSIEKAYDSEGQLAIAAKKIIRSLAQEADRCTDYVDKKTFIKCVLTSLIQESNQHHAAEESHARVPVKKLGSDTSYKLRNAQPRRQSEFSQSLALMTQLGSKRNRTASQKIKPATKTKILVQNLDQDEIDVNNERNIVRMIKTTSVSYDRSFRNTQQKKF